MPIGNCIIWTKSTSCGYGQLKRKGKHLLAHRLAYEKVFGKIPKGKVIDHLCRVPACINVQHMEVVTHKENIRRGKTAKIDLHKAKEIKTIYNSMKIKQIDLAKIYNIGQWEISRIVNNRRWT